MMEVDVSRASLYVLETLLLSMSGASQDSSWQNVRLYDWSIRYSSQGHVVDEGNHDAFEHDWLERRREFLREDQALPSFADPANWRRSLDGFVEITPEYEGYLSLRDFQNLVMLHTPTELIPERVGEPRHARCENPECGNEHPACGWRILIISNKETILCRNCARWYESRGKHRPARHLDR